MNAKLIGRHPAIRDIRRGLPALAHCGAHILIVGEPGVGKTLVGQMIHARGPAHNEELRSLNLALVPEREQCIALFGSDPPESTHGLKGFFEFDTTCLVRNVERASRHIQERLADALTTRTFYRIPHGPARPVQCRLIFTTSEVDFLNARRSRLIPELRHRLFHLPKITIPPLRERLQDIPLIAAYYRKRVLHASHPSLPSNDELLADKSLRNYPWHNNVTELKACLRASVAHTHRELLQQKERLEFEMIMTMLEEDGDFSLRRSTAIIEYHILQRVLARCRGSRTSAARALGLSYGALRRRCPA